MAKNAKPDAAKPECFVIMPVSDAEGYERGHFERVFRDLIEPACDKAGYSAIRASDVRKTDFIHLDILARLLESPMAVCDLSGLNPNVMFELGLRQAFNKPVALVQEEGTPAIFDVAPLRHVDYRPGLRYHEVPEDQENIAAWVEETVKAHKGGKGINSLVQLLSLTEAQIPEPGTLDAGQLLQLFREEFSSIRSEIREMESGIRGVSPRRKREEQLGSALKKAFDFARLRVESYEMHGVNRAVALDAIGMVWNALQRLDEEGLPIPARELLMEKLVRMGESVATRESFDAPAGTDASEEGATEP